MNQMNHESGRRIPAVVLSCHTIGLGVIRALGMMGVPVIAVTYENVDMGFVSKYVRHILFAPHPEKSESEFINLLVDKTRFLGDSLLIPADDATLGVVSRHKTYLEKYFIVACTEWEITERVIDKHYTYALANSIGVPAPWTLSPESEADLDKLKEQISYPCLVKPRQSHQYFERFRRKLVRVASPDEMRAAFREADQAGLKVLLQEWIPGDDTHGINYNSYFWDHRPLIEFTAEKVRLSPPGSGVPCVVQSKVIPEVLEPARKILKALKFYGYSCMEFKRDARDGTYKFMEVNGRHNRSTLLAVRCGINFPWIMYMHLTQGRLPHASIRAHDIYWVDEVRDLVSGVGRFQHEHYSFRNFAKPYLHSHVFAVFDWKDLRPFAKRCRDILCSVRDKQSNYKSTQNREKEGSHENRCHST
jgi:D-aspartate ligase